jgi:tRNA A37 threonylcarbamoyladenosine synthetase subunit TsaC/SUA5/YrdC
MTQTRLFTADILPEAVTLLKRGGVLIVPTDTVYGLV